MKIRGERECKSCGTQWSYYETGSVGCPACGSLESVGIDDRSEHTDLPAEFDLTDVRNAIDDVSTETVAERAAEVCRTYVRRRGFVTGGALRELDDTYLAANELQHVADRITRSHEPLDERDELYVLSLLRDADDGTRPPPSAVPPTLRDARGLAAANAVRDYRRDIRTWADDRSLSTDKRSALESLGEHVTRVRLLDGDVDAHLAEDLIETTRQLANGLRGDDVAFEQACDRLEELAIEP